MQTKKKTRSVICCMRVRLLHFTLVELVVALAIIAIGCSFAVAAFRGESPAQELNRVTLEFEAFCARVRFRCAEEGRNWVVCYNAEEHRFLAQTDRTEEETERLQTEGAVLPAPLSFPVPEDVQCLLTDDPFSGSGGTEPDSPEEQKTVFYFYPDGEAAVRSPLNFRRGRLCRSVQFSPLTSRLLIAEIREDEP